MNFTGKTILVSGSASGIGRSCAELLLENGASVVGLDINQSTITNERYRHYPIDIRDEHKVTDAIDEIEALYGKIDGLANCAGVYASSVPFYELNMEDWNKVISTNLTGLFILTKHAAKKMIKNNRGTIVNISCIRSKIFRPDMADYAASKGGVVALTSAMALDLQDYNIRVNSVAPGFTYTGMTADAFDNPEVKAYSETLIPARKIASSADIAKVILFLLSDMADYINGETIFVDGGFKISK
ncbi:3-oxoacyl-[acyl-carrier protein] reductase [Paenibacillus sophorae]|uniref:3-oxoacyl-[acyl-carrier protein] reductase n=1 Tax=Paenibacillus sophorae TaxID=1333845 RepID=A0A1H8KEV2_9BACL|nr:SDR family oxidoreductase [Paenibacillus sophorae]QWU13726.1 SDR family oxidoreductase [Paenibacillus sophorae]SEN91512.1 3-oxoacyl-[acyl-carrier protein] reductase [Paenibacillus sophorae]